MKLSEFLPDVGSVTQKSDRLDGMIGLFDVLTKGGGNSGNTYRPAEVGYEQLVNVWIRQQMAYRKQLIQDLFTLAHTVGELRTPILHLRGEVFRRGFSWAGKFVVKCTKCGQEHDQLVDKCEACGSRRLRKPEAEQRRRFETFLDDCNIWDQSFDEVLKQFYDSLNIADDGFLWLVKEYLNDGTKIRSKVLELRHINPALIEYDLTKDNKPKAAHWLCYLHRGEYSDVVEGEAGRCSVEGCRLELVPAMYKYTPQNRVMYLLDSEVIHRNKFTPSEMYGFSPILTIFEKALTLIGQDKTAMRYFFERKMPPSMIMVATDDVESLRREREEVIAKLRQDPDYIPMVAVSSRQNSRGRVDMVRLYHTFEEMNMMPLKQEIRERISALYGLSPIWQGAVESLGGISSQTQQLVVTSRVAEADQAMFNDKIVPQILEAFGITDWKYELLQPEEEAEQTRVSLAAQRIQSANMLFTMGFDVKLAAGVKDIDEVKFEVSGEAKALGGQYDPYGGGTGTGNADAEQGGAGSQDTGGRGV